MGLSQSERMPKAPLKWIVTGNLTADGAVAYLKSDQSFSRKVEDAQVFPSKEEAEAARLLTTKQEALVSDPYITEVAETAGKVDVLSARERIRSQGPSVPYGHAVAKFSKTV
jgi:hypothetical protein